VCPILRIPQTNINRSGWSVEDISFHVSRDINTERAFYRPSVFINFSRTPTWLWPRYGPRSIKIVKRRWGGSTGSILAEAFSRISIYPAKSTSRTVGGIKVREKIRTRKLVKFEFPAG
jgi:hypothetical protein